MENWIYHVLRAGGADDVYLVHIDPAVFEGTSWTYQKIEIAVTGTDHVTVISPEHYDGDITAEVTVTLDDSGNLMKIWEENNND